MSDLELKLLFLLIILITALSTGLFPLKLDRSDKNNLFFTISNSLSGGIFLGVGLIHLLPDGVEVLGDYTSYPLPYLLTGLSLAIFLFIEKALFIQHDYRVFENLQKKKVYYPYILAIILSIHSFVAGIALGIETRIVTSIVIFVAIIAHKGSAAFALSISMIRSKISKSRHIRVILLFSIMTPIGIIIGSFLSNAFSSSDTSISEGVFDCIAAGTFIYISVLDIIEEEFSIAGNEFLKFFFILTGFLMMALLGLWL